MKAAAIILALLLTGCASLRLHAVKGSFDAQTETIGGELDFTSK